MKKIMLDLTPLLDIILILLFAFMLNATVEGSQKEEDLLEQQNKNKYQSEVVNRKNEELNDKDKIIEQLSKNLEDKKEKINELQDSMEVLNHEIASERETIQVIYSQLSEWFADHENTLEQFMNQERLDTLIDPEQVIESLFKYETISKKYFFIDIRLEYPDNHLFINGVDTSIYISLEEASNMYSRASKKGKIKDAIEKIIDNKEGGYTFLLITASKDNRVHRLSYTLLWETIKDIEEKYGPDKVFKTEYMYQTVQ